MIYSTDQRIIESSAVTNGFAQKAVKSCVYTVHKVRKRERKKRKRWFNFGVKVAGILKLMVFKNCTFYI